MTTRIDRYRSWGQSFRRPSLGRRISYVKGSFRSVSSGLINSGAKLKRKFSSRRSSTTSEAMTNVDENDDDDDDDGDSVGEGEEEDTSPPPPPVKKPRHSYFAAPPSGKYETYGSLAGASHRRFTSFRWPSSYKKESPSEPRRHSLAEGSRRRFPSFRWPGSYKKESPSEPKRDSLAGGSQRRFSSFRWPSSVSTSESKLRWTPSIVKKALKKQKPEQETPKPKALPKPVPLQRPSPGSSRRRSSKKKSTREHKLQWTPSIVKKALVPQQKKKPPPSKIPQFLKPVPRKPSWREERPKNTAFVSSIAERLEASELQAKKVRQAALEKQKVKAKMKPVPLPSAPKIPAPKKETKNKPASVAKKPAIVKKSQMPKPVTKKQMSRPVQVKRQKSWRQERAKNTAVVASIAERFNAAELQAKKVRQAALEKQKTKAKRISSPKKEVRVKQAPVISSIADRFDSSELQAKKARQAALDKQKMKAKKKPASVSSAAKVKKEVPTKKQIKKKIQKPVVMRRKSWRQEKPKISAHVPVGTIRHNDPVADIRQSTLGVGGFAAFRDMLEAKYSSSITQGSVRKGAPPPRKNAIPVPSGKKAPPPKVAKKADLSKLKKLSDNSPELEPYRRMLKVGLPKGAIMNKMQKDGVHPDAVVLLGFAKEEAGGWPVSAPGKRNFVTSRKSQSHGGSMSGHGNATVYKAGVQKMEEEVHRLLSDMKTLAAPKKEITFGEVFRSHEWSNKLAALLFLAKKRNLVHYPGELLNQTRDDKTLIRLL